MNRQAVSNTTENRMSWTQSVGSFGRSGIGISCRDLSSAGDTGIGGTDVSVIAKVGSIALSGPSIAGDVVEDVEGSRGRASC